MEFILDDSIFQSNWIWGCPFIKVVWWSRKFNCCIPRGVWVNPRLADRNADNRSEQKRSEISEAGFRSATRTVFAGNESCCGSWWTTRLDQHAYPINYQLPTVTDHLRVSSSHAEVRQLAGLPLNTHPFITHKRLIKGDEKNYRLSHNPAGLWTLIASIAVVLPPIKPYDNYLYPHLFTLIKQFT